MSDIESKRTPGRESELAVALVAAASIVMIVFTFVVSNLELKLSEKYALLAPGAIAYILVCMGVFRWQRKRIKESAARDFGSHASDIDAKLASLADANEFLGASLRPDDLFRLVTSRLCEIVPFATCVLIVREPESGAFQVRCAAGDNAQFFSAGGEGLGRGIASDAIVAGGVVRDPKLARERNALPPDALRGLGSAAAAALSSDGETFGALAVYSKSGDDFGGELQTRLAAAAERIAPFLSGSFAFEKSIDNALTDPVTSLPNERGFFLVLESRIAESHRFKDAKPLTVLALDVVGFSDFNENFGHSMGNALLSHVAGVARNELRQMDVITRSRGDEFLAVLPTAGESVVGDIVSRLKKVFAENPFGMDHGTAFNVALNFGAATFGRDGETAPALLNAARMRKQESKAKEGKILFFPKDSVN